MKESEQRRFDVSDPESISTETAKAAAQAERSPLEMLASKQAQRLWSKTQTAESRHAYLQGKGILGNGVHQYKESLIIPIHDSTKTIWSLQFIDPNGKMRFFKEGALDGHYFTIGSIDKASRVYICEGFI